MAKKLAEQIEYHKSQFFHFALKKLKYMPESRGGCQSLRSKLQLFLRYSPRGKNDKFLHLSNQST